MNTQGKKSFYTALTGTLVGILIGALLMWGGFTVFAPNSGNNKQQVIINDESDSIGSTVAKKVSPSVVGISVKGNIRDFLGMLRQSEGTGSGVIVREDGYILTNYHVIANALDETGKMSDDAEIDVTFLGDAPAVPPIASLPAAPSLIPPVKAKVVGSDHRTDLAVLKVDKTGLAAIEWGDSSKLEVGETVLAIGNPGGMNLAWSVSKGIVSGLNRKVRAEYNEFSLIQTDATINPGNSGGALVNSNGELVGINTIKMSGEGFEGLGFAIPSNEAKEIIEDLIVNKYVKGRPYLGVIINERFPAEALKARGYPEGLLVDKVRPFSGASEAGLQTNDIIVKANGVEVKTFAELSEEIKKHKVGESIELDIYRYKEEKTVKVKVTLGEETGGQQ